MPATPSHVAMLRGAIALAWVDGTLGDSEKQRLHLFIENNMHLTKDQKHLLASVIEQPCHLQDVWDDIHDPLDRAHLINIATLIFWQDKDYSTAEKQAFTLIQEQHLVTLDVTGMQEELSSMAELSRRRMRLEDEEYVQSLSFPARMLYYLESLTTPEIA